MAECSDAREGLERLDVDLEAIALQLEREGVTKFIEPFDKLQQWLEERRRGRRASCGGFPGGAKWIPMRYGTDCSSAATSCASAPAMRAPICATRRTRCPPTSPSR